ncbi:helix-turn-helix transcriptional regulator [Paenibacillus sp. QZ-Y1]|uniref:helix-turn-helix transcriptional regulator n=1 Tax=Paenibacillus sp. QZ-Y1 TaxID=3414511 RepID=UPI003F79040A
MLPLQMSKEHLGAGTIEIFNINQVHRLWQTDENNVVLQINIDAEFAKGYYQDLSYVWFAHEFSPRAYLGLERIEGINEEICTFITPIVTTSEVPLLSIKNTVEHLLDLLIMNFDAKRMFEGNATKLQRIGRIYDYLFNHRGFINKASLNDIAKHTEEYLNLDYLSSQFKLLIGDTLQNLLHYLRIEHAIKQLLTTEQSLVEISIESGFSSPRYFYQRFNKIFPEGPKVFREQHIKKREMKERAREVIDPALVLARHRSLFKIPETISNERNRWIPIDIFGPDEEKSTLEETLDSLNCDDIQVLTWIINQFTENDISPVFIVRTGSNAIAVQITTIQQLLHNYTLTYSAEHMKGWRIELQ